MIFTATLQKADEKNQSIKQSLTFNKFAVQDEVRPPLPPTPTQEYKVTFKAESTFPLGQDTWYANNSQINTTWIKEKIIANKTQIFNITDNHNQVTDDFLNKNITITGLNRSPEIASLSFACALANPTNTTNTPIQKTIAFNNFKNPRAVVDAEVQRIQSTKIELKVKELTETTLKEIKSSNVLEKTNLQLDTTNFQYVVPGLTLDRNSKQITFQIKVIVKEVNTVEKTTTKITLSYTIAPTPPVVDPLQEEVARVNKLSLALKDKTYTTDEIAVINYTNILDHITGFDRTTGFDYTVEVANFDRVVPTGDEINTQPKNISFNITISSKGKSIKSQTFTLEYHIAKTQLEGLRIVNKLDSTLELKNFDLTLAEANNVNGTNIIPEISDLKPDEFKYVVSQFQNRIDYPAFVFEITIENLTDPKKPWTVPEEIQVPYHLTISTEELEAEKTRIESIKPLELIQPEMTSSQLEKINESNLISRLKNLNPSITFDYSVTGLINDSANKLLKFKIVISNGENQVTTGELQVSYTINESIVSPVTQLIDHLNTITLEFDNDKMQAGTFLKLNKSAFDPNFVLNFLNFNFSEIERKTTLKFDVDKFSLDVINYTCSFEIIVRDGDEQQNTTLKHLTYNVPTKFLGKLDQLPSSSEVKIANSQKGKLEMITVEPTSSSRYNSRFETINNDIKQKIKELVYQVRFIFYQSFNDNATSIDYGIVRYDNTSATVQLKAMIRDTVTFDQLILLTQAAAQKKTYTKGQIVTITLTATGLNQNWLSITGGEILPGLSSPWSLTPGNKDEILAGADPSLFAANMGSMTLDINGTTSQFTARGFCFMRPYKKN